MPPELAQHPARSAVSAHANAVDGISIEQVSWCGDDGDVQRLEAMADAWEVYFSDVEGALIPDWHLRPCVILCSRSQQTADPRRIVAVGIALGVARQQDICLFLHDQADEAIAV